MLLEKRNLNKAQNTNAFVNHGMPNKSMDVRAKQRLSYQRALVIFGGLGGGFAPRHLNRSEFLHKPRDKFVDYFVDISSTWR